MSNTLELSICFPVYDDYCRLEASLIDLITTHNEVAERIEVIVVNNNPDSEEGKATQKYVEGPLSKNVKARHISAPGPGGPAIAKQRCVDEAASDFVLVVDAHVTFAPGSIARLIEYYSQHPETIDLHSGPIYYDEDLLRAARRQPLQVYTTDMAEVWRGYDLGIWSTNQAGRFFDAEPFEIAAMGAGVFTCRKDAFVGFCPHVRGFGGEEFYLYRKTRKAGGKGICLPFLQWNHRWVRPNGAPYPLNLWDRMRNYVLTHQDIGYAVEPIYDVYCAEHRHVLTREELANENITTILDYRMSLCDADRVRKLDALKAAIEEMKTGKGKEEYEFLTWGGFTDAQWKYLLENPVEHISPPTVTTTAKSGCGCGGAKIEQPVIAGKLPMANSPPEQIAARKAELAALRANGMAMPGSMPMRQFEMGIVQHIREGRLVKRDSCIYCVEKHVGKASVLHSELIAATETNNVAVEMNHLEIIGNLQAAADEAEEWPELYEAIKAAENEYRYKGIGPDWKAIAMLMVPIKEAVKAKETEEKKQVAA